jgi:gas vesicle protein
MGTHEKNGLAKGLFVGFLAGSVLGAIAGLLYAPKSGRELRSDIKQKAGNLADDATEYVRTARVKTVDLLNKGKERSDQLVSEAKEKAEHILGDAERVLTGIRDRAQTEPGKLKAAFRAGVDAYKAEKERDHETV